MILVCPKCSSRLQASGTKPPVHPFSIRCPKCNSTVNSEPPSPASEQSALTVGASPATAHRRFEGHVPAPLFEVETGGASEPPNLSSVEDLSRMLASLLGQGVIGSPAAPSSRPSWNPRKVLVCTTESHRKNLAIQLAQQGYQVFVAQDTRQAVERMRADGIDVVLLEADFDLEEQGAAFVTREVNVLRPAQRRRLFFVLLSPVLRSIEGHAAFLQNVIGIVYLNDVDELPGILEDALREYNELYKEFNAALNVHAL
jgi:hypothetical protein